MRAARRYVQEGRRYVVDVDLERSFDRYEGTPQGGPLSPLPANVLLDEVDKELERRGHVFVRYADDANVYVASRRAGQLVMELLRRLFAQLKLRINEAKSAVELATNRKFPGYSFWIGPGRTVRFRVASKALESMKRRVRRITRRSGGRSMEQVVVDLRGYLVGWKNYFGLAETPSIFDDLDEWLRHRLRALHLKQWKGGRTVYRELRARGASERVAATVAANTRRWWKNAALYLHLVLTTRYFDGLGVPRFAK